MNGRKLPFKLGSVKQGLDLIRMMNSLEVRRGKPELNELCSAEDDWIDPISCGNFHRRAIVLQQAKFAFEPVLTQEGFSVIPFPQCLGNKHSIRTGDSPDRPAAAWVWIPLKHQRICIERCGDSHAI